MSAAFQSWGRFPTAHHQVHRVFWRDEPILVAGAPTPVLPYGLGRSYGDVCLNDGGTLLAARGLNRFLSLSASGVLRCEAGVSFAEVLALVVPRGWFLPVTPGTKYVTLGGAIANDVHGKNHHRAGCFGAHVLRFELARSGGERLVCSRDRHPELFAATIGGLGLTGLILWAEMQLIPIQTPAIDTETIPFANFSEFLDLSAASGASFPYTVAWIDCMARASELGRGIFSRGDHRPQAAPRPVKSGRAAGIPVDLPAFVLNPWSIRLFNTVYYHRQKARPAQRIEHYETFFYPLDAVHDYNRLFGSRGLLQYQCVIPFAAADAMREILDRIARSRLGSFVAVLKTMGDVPSPGMLSFPKPGITLALDFRNTGADLFQLLDTLDEIVVDARGAVYPAKDARMSAVSFRRFYPNWEEFARYVDPAFSSGFWRRVTSEKGRCANC